MLNGCEYNDPTKVDGRKMIDGREEERGRKWTEKGKKKEKSGRISTTHTRIVTAGGQGEKTLEERIDLLQGLGLGEVGVGVCVGVRGRGRERRATGEKEGWTLVPHNEYGVVANDQKEANPLTIRNNPNMRTSSPVLPSLLLPY